MTTEISFNHFQLDHEIAWARSKSSSFQNYLLFGAYESLKLTDLCSLAIMEMRLVLARLFFEYDFELMLSYENWHDQKIYLLWEKGPLVVKLTPAKNLSTGVMTEDEH